MNDDYTAYDFNRPLRRGILIVAIVLGSISVISLFLASDETFQVLDAAPAKYVFIVLDLSAITAVAVLAYFFTYAPNPRVIASNMWVIIAGMVAVASGGALLGLPVIESLRVDPGHPNPITIDWKVREGSDWTLGMSGLMLMAATLIYFYVAHRVLVVYLTYRHLRIPHRW